jgi:GNAT superfamily N-acetyltransferase
MNPDLKKSISFDSIKIEPIREEYVQPSIELWTTQFKNVRNTVQDIPGKWITDLTAIRLFLEEHAETGKGVVAKVDGDVLGYMVYESFPFHGADTVYCSIMGHASVESGRARIYQEMYRYLSDVWVRDSALDHIVTFFSLDAQLKRVLFDLGFGLYVVDAYRSAEPIDPSGYVSIMEASLNDVDDVMRLGEESRHYYRGSPIFLVRKKEKREYYEDFISDDKAAVFIAKLDGRTVGFMSIKRNSRDDVITLADKDTGMIDEIGAYIQPSCRGHGVGARLLNHVLGWCREQRVDRIHVDYESANLYASGFWPKHFTPTMYSVRRRVNPDILHGST